MDVYCRDMKKTVLISFVFNISNVLTPCSQAFVPHMAKEYGCEYEFVQYKWPGWLHHQTEKQRIIWGYVITLFHAGAST